MRLVSNSAPDLETAATAITDLLGGMVEQVILFGSEATGTASPDSDVDIAIIVPECPSPFLGYGRKASSRAASILQRDVDLSFYGRQQFERNRHFELNVEHAIANGRVLRILEDAPLSTRHLLTRRYCAQKRRSVCGRPPHVFSNELCGGRYIWRGAQTC